MSLEQVFVSGLFAVLILALIQSVRIVAQAFRGMWDGDSFSGSDHPWDCQATRQTKQRGGTARKRSSDRSERRPKS